ncbi:amino acid permease [Sphingopyxis sp. DBS4]|uniref:amino acid permease n=1 Tax=Sphingopyxis sp. DBS4 TaxID=2968500 RepID=UPI00214CC0AB|nr:amino acid permease [Sphingopyxis sp. DBS4]
MVQTLVDTDDEPTLRPHLGLWHLIAAGVGSTIGSGIFVITGTAAAQYAGPAISLSFLLAAAVCLCTAYCYGELAGLLPKSGGAYSYALASSGPLIGWTVGWCLVLEYLVACSTVAVGWSSYFVDLVASVGVPVPQWIAAAPINFDAAGHPVATGALFNLPAALIVGLVTALLVVGIKETNRANIAMVVIKVGVILLVVAFGAAYVRPAHFIPYIPENTGHYGEFGWSGVLRGSAVIFYAFLGFDGVSTSAQESRNPQRDIGWGIIGALAVCTILYVAMALVMTGMADYRTLNVANPVSVALAAAGGDLDWLRSLVNVGVVIGLASAILMGLYGQSRILYVMAQDRMVPPIFARISPRFRTPVHGTLIVGFACALIAGLFPIDILGELVSIGSLLAFAFVCWSVLVLRRRLPDAPRPFRVPLSPLLPVIGICSTLYLMVSLPEDTWIRLLLWMALGTGFYLAYSRPRRRTDGGGN